MVQSGTLDSLEEDAVVVSEVVSAEVELSVLEDPGCGVPVGATEVLEDPGC